MPSQQVTRVRLSCLECCGLMTQLGRKEDQLFGTCGPFKEWVVLLFDTNPFKGTVLLRNNLAKSHVLTWCIGHLVLQIASVKRLEHNDLAANMHFQMIGPRLTDAHCMYGRRSCDFQWVGCFSSRRTLTPSRAEGNAPLAVPGLWKCCETSLLSLEVTDQEGDQVVNKPIDQHIVHGIQHANPSHQYPDHLCESLQDCYSVAPVVSHSRGRW